VKVRIAKGRFRSLRPPVVQVKIVFPSETHPAVHLDSAIAHGAARVAGVKLGDGNRRSGVRRALLKRPSGVVNRGTGTLGFEVHIRALVLDRLKDADRLAELTPDCAQAALESNNKHTVATSTIRIILSRISLTSLVSFKLPLH